MLLEERHDLGLARRRESRTQQQRAVLPTDPNRDSAQQTGDHEGRDRVGIVTAGRLRQQDAAESDQHAQACDAVLGQHRQQRRIARRPQIGDEALLAALLIHDADGLLQDHPIDHERDSEHRVVDPTGIGQVRIHQHVHAVVQREPAAEHEDADRAEQREEEPLDAQPVREHRAGHGLAATDANPQQGLVAGVGGRVDGLGEHRAGPGDPERDELQHGQDAVADDGHDDRTFRISSTSHDDFPRIQVWTQCQTRTSDVAVRSA